MFQTLTNIIQINALRNEYSRLAAEHNPPEIDVHKSLVNSGDCMCLCDCLVYLCAWYMHFTLPTYNVIQCHTMLCCFNCPQRTDGENDE